ncbi:MAG: dimethylamine corrinoid protein 3, partial [Anaerolineae bacterium]|nr:dimethylamine corrinoid protein 3 [Anaerolineae bacterium]
MSEELFKEMAQSILDGDDEVSAELAQKALTEGIDPLAAITDGFMPGVNEVGENFACGDAFLPELVMA